MLEIRNLTKVFKKKEALCNISLSLEDGVYGLLGANGAGKTTLLRCIALLYSEGYASVFLNNENVAKDKNYLNKIGYLPQQFGLFKDLTVFEALMLMANFKGVKKHDATEAVEKCIEIVNLTEEKKKKVRALSGGMIRRLGIAQTLLNDPEIIIFDEPTAGLDPVERLRFKSIISKIEKNRVIIISTHIVEDIEAVCDKVIIMDYGKVKSCSTCNELQAKAYGKVYEILETDMQQIIGKCYLEKTYENKDGVFARVLASEQQIFPPCAANIEDGYLCTIKEI